MYKVYGDVFSGNCYKVKLALTQLDQPFEWVALDVLRKQTRSPEYLAKNPNGKIPLLELESGELLAESNAILHYLANGTELLPAASLPQAQVLQWLFFEQYSHEPHIAVARFIVLYLGTPDDQKERLESAYKPGYAALDIMEQHLAGRRFMVADRYTIADIALYAYTHVADEGGFDLAAYPAVRDWLARVSEQPGYVAMGKRPQTS